MMNITNARIEKQKNGIEKTKSKIAEFQAKLREQEKTLRLYEDLEIVAQYRSDTMNESYKSRLKAEKTYAEETQTTAQADISKEVSTDADSKNE